MKKIVITALIAISMGNTVFAQEAGMQAPLDVDMMYDQFFESPIPIPTVVTAEEQQKVINMSSTTRGTPLFKRMRIKVTNYFRKKDYAYYEKLQQEQAAMLEDDDIDDVEQGLIEVNDTVQKGKAEKNAETELTDSTDEAGNDEKTLELSGEVKAQKVENEVLLDCDRVIYDEVNDEIQAIGSPILIFPPQKVSLKADKMTYNNSSNILKAYGNVTLEKDNATVVGDYVQINMNEENAFMDTVKFKQSSFVVHARQATAESDTLVFEDGKMVAEESYILDLKTRMIRGQDFTQMLLDDEEKSYLSESVGQVPFHLKAENILVEGKKDHDTVTIKNGEIYYGDTKLWRFKNFTAHTDKEHKFFEANYPELGSRPRIGMFVGPGYVFDLPNGAVVKAIPFLNYKNDFGIGGAIKYRTANNMTDAMYGSAEDIFVVKGRQRLDDKLYFQYGVNSYIREGFMGQNMAKYAAELYYEDKTLVKDTLTKGLDLKFRHKAGIGYMHNTSYNKFFGNLPFRDIGTTRFKYMAEIEQSLFKRVDKENQKMIDLGISMQGSAAVYGTGDTQFIGRIGPRMHTQYKRWMQDIAYYVAAYDDHTPLTRFDFYRYGASSVYIREALRISKYLSIGWNGNINLSDDAPNGKMFQENAFIVAVGPDDFKLNLGYDFVRRRTYFAFVLGMDLKDSSVEYKRLEIKNPDRIARVEDKPEKLLPTFEEVQLAKQKKNKLPQLKYAEVIDIEDPSRDDL